jgi:hypothetical protein
MLAIIRAATGELLGHLTFDLNDEPRTTRNPEPDGSRVSMS